MGGIAAEGRSRRDGRRPSRAPPARWWPRPFEAQQGKAHVGAGGHLRSRRAPPRLSVAPDLPI